MTTLELFILGSGAPNPYCDSCSVLTKNDKTPLALAVIDDLVERGLLQPITIYVATDAGNEIIRSHQQQEDAPK